jgi:hypothetical protein
MPAPAVGIHALLSGLKDANRRDESGHEVRRYRYLKAIMSVRLSVDAPAFKGSFVAFELC